MYESFTKMLISKSCFLFSISYVRHANLNLQLEIKRTWFEQTKFFDRKLNFKVTIYQRIILHTPRHVFLSSWR